MKWYQYEKIDLSLSAKYGIYLIIYVIICLGVFSTINARKISRTVLENLEYSTHLQSVNVDKIIEQQIDKLESLSYFIAKQDSITHKSVLQMAESMAEKTTLSHIFVAGKDGKAYFNDGNVYDISDQYYFEKPMNGEMVIADSAQSLINEEYRVVMSLPIYIDTEIIGVVGGSFDFFDLDRMIFFDHLSTTDGISVIMTPEGELVSINDKDKVVVSNDFHSLYQSVEFKNVSITEVKENLKTEETSSYLASIDGKEYYISLDVLETNEWLLGYIIPITVAHAQYDFVYLNEVALFAFIGFGFVVYLLFILHNFRKEQKMLIQKATLDSLTSLLNKKSTEEQIKKQLTHCSLSALIIVDVDDFKLINDRCGHDMGDLYLTKIADCLREFFRKDDIIGRIGGDEMMVFMSNISSSDDVCLKVEKFLKRINELAGECPNVEKTSCSVGISLYPNDGETFETLYKKADIALYEIKNKEKGGYCIYEEDK